MVLVLPSHSLLGPEPLELAHRPLLHLADQATASEPGQREEVEGGSD